MSSAGVTSTAECHSTNGRVVSVIDTPGLFDLHVGAEFISKEIAKCVELAPNGIHATLLVFSIRGRFTEEEVAALPSLQTLFGPKITDYMILVFTGGDSLEQDQSLEDYLICGPELLKRVLQVCKNRIVLFDNGTKDEKIKAFQLQKLLALVDEVILENGGHLPCAEFRAGAVKLQQKEDKSAITGHNEPEPNELNRVVQKSYDEHLKRMTEMAESKLMVTTEMLKQELADEKAAHLKTEMLKLELADDDKAARLKAKMLKQQLADEKADHLKAEKVAQIALEKLEEVRKLKQNLEVQKRIAHDA